MPPLIYKGVGLGNKPLKEGFCRKLKKGPGPKAEKRTGAKSSKKHWGPWGLMGRLVWVPIGPHIFSRELGRAGGARARKISGPMCAPQWSPIGSSFFLRLLHLVLFSDFGSVFFCCFGLQSFFFGRMFSRLLGTSLH